MAVGIVIEEKPMDATMALEIKRGIKDGAIPFGSWKRAGELDLALEAIIQGRHVVTVKQTVDNG